MEPVGTAATLSRRRFLASGAVGAAAVAVPGTIARAASASRSPRDLEGFISSKMAEAGVPGLSACVVHGRRVVWARGFGWANVHRGERVTTDTIFMLASISKTVVATAVMQAVERGLIDLEVDINDVLPFRVHNPAHPFTVITPRMLLTHTAALRDNWSVLTPSYVRGDSSVPLETCLRDYFSARGGDYDPQRNFYPYPPGSRYNYCNMGVDVAAYLVEAVSGVPFDDWCDRKIFAPLGMERTGWHLADVPRTAVAMPYKYIAYRDAFRPFGQYGYPDYPDGELRTPSTDLARHLMMIISGGGLGGVRLLQERTVREMLRPQFPDVVERQGIIWYPVQRTDDLYWGHTGGDWGVSTRCFFRQSDGTGIITLTNGTPVRHGWRALRDVEIRLFADADRL
ncbi:MAG: beta-lactamase family protein [Actinomycetota bacterium]|nr:beta-lactamase family protein [Actinomycetota bacterium]